MSTTQHRDPDDMPGLNHYRRALERGLPRWDGRSPALKAKQAARAAQEARAAAVRAAEEIVRKERQDYAERSAARKAEFDRLKAADDAVAERAAASRAVTACVDSLRARFDSVDVRYHAAAIETQRALLENGAPPKIPVMQIIAETALLHHVSPNDILSVSRVNYVVKARYEAISLVYIRRPDLSLTQIGAAFGGRDRTTMLHALRKTRVYRGGA